LQNRANQTITELKNMVNPIVISQLSAFLVAVTCFYASNIITFTSPSIPLYMLPIPPAATLLLKPHLKITIFGAYITINGNFWIPIAVNPTLPYVFFAVGSTAFALALMLDTHPETAPSWYGILRAKYEINEIRNALKAILSNTHFTGMLIALQASAFTLTVTSFYHYAVNYIVNGGSQWEILVGTTLINSAIPIMMATTLILVIKIATYKKIKQVLQEN